MPRFISDRCRAGRHAFIEGGCRRVYASARCVCTCHQPVAERPAIQGDVGIDCPCGGRMLEKRPGEFPRDVACPRCGLTPLDLVRAKP